MLNIIKSDCYRIKNQKGIYITLVLLILLLILEGLGASGHIGVSTSEMNQEIANQDRTGILMPIVALQTIDNQVYFLLAFVIFIAAADFSTKTIKNAIASGVSRFEYYMSKFILGAISAFFVVLMCALVPTLTAVIKNGFGASFPEGYWLILLKGYAMAYLMYLALTTFILMLIFVTKRVAAVNGIYVAFCLAPSIIISILSFIDDKFFNLFDYEFIFTLRHIGNVQSFASADYIRVLASAGIMITLSLVTTYLSFRKCDIK